MNSNTLSYAECGLIFALVALVGCGSSATIQTRGGWLVDGRIVRADDSRIYLDGSGGETRVPRRDIVDIDHPGSVAAAFGGAIGAYGVVNIALRAPKCNEEGGAFCVGVFTPALIGVSLVLYGAIVHARSVAAAAGRSTERFASLRYLGPAPLVTRETVSPGLSLAATF